MDMPQILEMVDFIFQKTLAIDTTHASIKLTYSKDLVTAELEVNGLEIFMDVKKYLTEAGLELVKGTKFESMAIALLYAGTLEYV